MEEQHPPRGDRGSILIAASVIGAALILSWGMSSSAPRYQLAASGDTVVRMDADSGELIACNQQRCARKYSRLHHRLNDSFHRDSPLIPSH